MVAQPGQGLGEDIRVFLLLRPVEEELERALFERARDVRQVSLEVEADQDLRSEAAVEGTGMVPQCRRSLPGLVILPPGKGSDDLRPDGVLRVRVARVRTRGPPIRQSPGAVRSASRGE